MKRSVIAIFALALSLVSCQKNLDGPAASDGTVHATEEAQSISVPVAGFGAVTPYWTITARQKSLIFSDSLDISGNDAFLQALKFNVVAKKIFFTNYALLINGHRVMVTGNYENEMITIALNKKKALPVGKYKIELEAKVYGPQQVFRMDLLPGYAVITDSNGFLATVNGLPQLYLIGTRKN